MDDVQRILAHINLGNVLYAFQLKDTVQLFKCYQHFEQAICHLLLPKCNPVTNKITTMCKETCLQMLDACWEDFSLIISRLSDQKEKGQVGDDVLHYSDPITVRGTLDKVRATCSYLPSMSDKHVQCFYLPVVCSPPTFPSNIKVKWSPHNFTQSFPHNSTMKISCMNDTDKLKGKNSVTCLYSGEWSEMPQCVAEIESPVPVVLTILATPMVFVLSICVWYHCKKPTNVIQNRNKAEMQEGNNIEMQERNIEEMLERNIEELQERNIEEMQERNLEEMQERNIEEIQERRRQYHAFISYHSDTDENFVIDVLLLNLKQFQLLVHSLDFVPGAKIFENIENAIENSNCAIFIVSQGFVESRWCMEEFGYCYLENMNDPAYKLYVIMPPKDEQKLLNVSAHRRLNHIINERTYLEKGDPDLWCRLGSELSKLEVLGDTDEDDPDVGGEEEVLGDTDEDDLDVGDEEETLLCEENVISEQANHKYNIWML